MTSEERAVLIAGKLALNKNDPILWDKNLANWLSSQDGILAVKARMIDNGYNMLIVKFDKGYWCGFELNGKYPIYIGDGCYPSEAEAVLAACEKALRAEVSEIL